MKQALELFKQIVKNERLAHLYTISGPRGAGKFKLALNVAYIIMSNGTENENLWHQIMTNNCGNLFVVEKDGMQIKKDQIEALKQEFSKTSLVSMPRVYIIKDVHLLNQTAGNRLLKFMEEPEAKDVYGLLLTDNAPEVLRTITSRSQLITINSASEDIIKEELLNLGIDKRIATIAPYLTKDIDEAKSFMDNAYFLLLLDTISIISKEWKNKDFSFVIYFKEAVLPLVVDYSLYKTFLEMLVLYFLDLAHYRMHQDILYDFLREDIIVNSDLLSIKEIHVILEFIKNLIKNHKYYINLNLALDNLAIQLERRR